MIKYESIPAVALNEESATLPTHALPELVHLDDPAFFVMSDFSLVQPHTISENESMEDALNEMKISGVHLLLVIDHQKHIKGLISSEDLLGEKPINFIQQHRIQRAQILVKSLMVPLKNIIAFEYEAIEHTRVGNVVKTMQELKTHYALVIKTNEQGLQIICGLFNTSQMSKQLHQNVISAISHARSISELHKRKS